jgi:HD-like signal output (HDOD) protein
VSILSDNIKAHILFVDDDARILQGLKRSLRIARHEWEMFFAGGGQEALSVLAETPIDIVISDMRMPGMDGAELLTRVRTLHPGTIRFILSGHADKEMIVRTIGPTHQYFAKPCDTEVLVSAVARVRSLDSILQNASIRELVAGLNSLPSQPSKFEAVVKELQSETPDRQHIVGLISSDAGMSARLLQLVSSSFFGFRNHIASPVEAADILGLDTLRTLFEASGIFSIVGPDCLAGFDLEGFWRHSSAVAVLASKIATELDKNKRIAEDAYMAGLMHDIGRLVVATSAPDKAAEIASLVEHNQIPPLAAERRVLSATHGDIGAYLLGLWGLPALLVHTLAYHHNPSDCPDEPSALLTAVHAANVLVQLDPDGQERTIETPLDEAYLERVGAKDALPVWRELYASSSPAGARL